MAGTKSTGRGYRFILAGVTVAAIVSGGLISLPQSFSEEKPQAAAQAPSAIPVSVAAVLQKDLIGWKEFSGRLEAIERVEIRSRVAGQVKAIHFREGSLVRAGDLLVSIDPEPFLADLSRAKAGVSAAQARVNFTRNEHERAQKLVATRILTVREADTRTNAYQEAQANLRAAQAEQKVAELNLGYTEIHAPVSGRVGKILVNAGNLVPAGETGPALTTLVSVDPIYASFDADEQVVLEAVRSLGTGSGGNRDVSRIPAQMESPFAGDEPISGRLQLIDNIVDANSGTVRVRAEFANPDGLLIPGQFARLAMGTARAEPALLVTERAVGVDQGKKYVLVVGADDTVSYREVELGRSVERLRVVLSGLTAGERIVVNGLQRVRPGARVAPEMIPMTPDLPLQTAAN